MTNGKPQSDVPLIIKILIMGGLVLLLLVPLIFIQILIYDRSETRKKAEREVIASWGGAQTVTGPMISVPYFEKGSLRYLLFMPDSLAIQGGVEPTILHRGIYDAAVYNADLALVGDFARPSFHGTGIPEKSVRWDLARIVLSLKNPLGLRERIQARINGESAVFETERHHPGPFSFNLSAPLNLAGGPPDSRPIRFSLTVKLKGGRALAFVPTAENTSVSLSSGWRHPSFFGPPLPAERTLTDAGFEAVWNLVQHRPIPGRLTAAELEAAFREPEWSARDNGEKSDRAGGSFGVELMIPVDAYVKSDRSAKYGLLFLLVPFIALLLFELTAKIRIHLIQYFLVGVANVVFYLLLISFSEHLSFDPAYLVAAGLTTLLTGFYAAAFLKTAARAVSFTAILALFYGFLYLILLSPEYALLVSAIGVFGVLALLMLLTRRIDWFTVKPQKSGAGQDQRAAPPPTGAAG